jgi:hypothetical protein
MALGAYDFFKNHQNLNSSIYYMPINKGYYLNIYPQTPEVYSKYRLSINEYMSAVGIKITQSAQQLENKKSKIAKNLFNAFETEYETVLYITEKLRNFRNDGKALKNIYNDNDAKKAIKDLKAYCGITQEELDQFDFKNRNVIDFFSGGWFEYFVFEQLQKLPIYDIKYNVNIEIESNSENNPKVTNELDVVFIVNNILHIIECKTGKVKEIINDTIYKAGQLKQSFGLSANSHLIILNPPSDKISPEKLERAKLFNIDLIDSEIMKQKSLTEIFKEKLKL